MTELEKAKETKAWLWFFMHIVEKTSQYSTPSTFEANLKTEIRELITTNEEIIEKLCS